MAEENENVRNFVDQLNRQEYTEGYGGKFSYERSILKFIPDKQSLHDRQIEIVVPPNTSSTLAKFVILYLVAKVALQDDDAHLRKKSEVMSYFFAEA